MRENASKSMDVMVGSVEMVESLYRLISDGSDDVSAETTVRLRACIASACADAIRALEAIQADMMPSAALADVAQEAKAAREASAALDSGN